MKKALLLAAVLLAASCSTTKFLAEGEYRLASNSISVTNDPKFRSNELTQYIKQQPNSYFIFGWNPFLNIYNWGDNSGEGIDKIWRKIGVPPVVFAPNLVESSCENITNHLKYLGYYNSHVQAEVNTRNKLARVNYSVTLGKRYRIDSLVYDIPDQKDFASLFSADSVRSLVKPGMWLAENVLESESSRSAAMFRENGYYEFNKNNYFFEADTVTTPGVTVLKYAIKGYTRNEKPDENAPLTKSKFGEVTISHSTGIKLRESVLDRMNLIKPGDYYRESTVNNSYARFSSMKLFSSVTMQLSQKDSAVVDCNIRLVESKKQGFKIDLQASTNSSSLIGISPQLTWFHKNIFHGGEWLTLGFTGNFQFQPNTDIRSNVLGVNASLSIPSFLGLPNSIFKGANVPRTEIKTSYSYQDRPEYKRHVASANYGYSWRTDKKLFFQINPLQMNFVKLKDMSDDFLEVLMKNPYLWDAYSDHIDMGIGGVIFKTSTTDIVPKTSYRFVQFSFDLSGNFLSLFNGLMNTDDFGYHMLFGVPYAQYVRGEVQLGNALRFGRDNGQALAMRMVAGAGAAYGNSLSMPYEKQFFCGGASSMRAWQTHALGPGCEPCDTTFSIPSQTGNLKLEADLEWRFKLVWKLEGAVFTEAGNIWTTQEQSRPSFESIAADWGLGIRLNMDFILVRVDAGFKVREPSRAPGSRWIGPPGWFSKDGYAIHFGIGYPF